MFSLRSLRYLTILAAILLAVAVFLPWITVESIQLTISGMNTEGTDFGKPGYFHLAMGALFLIFSFTPRIWAKRTNLLIVALNLAWAIRNFIMIGACSGGECPSREIGLWIVLLSSLMMLLGALFPDVDMEKTRRKNNPGGGMQAERKLGRTDPGLEPQELRGHKP